MVSDSGRHNADDNPADRARVDYLAGELEFGSRTELDDGGLAELDGLRSLLADPTLWAEPPAGLEDSVVALIAAEAGGSTDSPAPPAVLTTDSAGRPDDGPGAQPAADGNAPADLAAARRNRDRRDGRRRFTRPVMLIAAAAAVLVFALTGVFFLRDSTSQRRFDVALSATDLAPGAAGSATMLKTDSGWEIHLAATGLPRLDGGQFYQGWLRNAAGVLVPIGTFNEGTDVTLWSGVPPDAFPTMTITKESADGVQDSSGQRVLVGTAVEDP
jgi:hypothetical protein